MGEDFHHEELSERPETPPPSIPPPANPETMPENIETASSEGTEELERKQTNKSDMPEPEYPTMAKVIPIVAALYAAFFLVALVPPPISGHLRTSY